MPEIELSLMADETGAEVRLRRLLVEFETQHHVDVRVRFLPYNEAWAEMVRFGLYNHGPDVSQVGSTWISNLVSMNALRAFTERELADLGAPAIFLPAIWESGLMPRESQVWAIPWLADTRLLYYRRDLLEQAGVDETGAFDTPARLAQTLERLQASQATVPWVVETERDNLTLHNVSSWVWQRGGDFVRADGRQVSFTQPEALGGLCAYFDLYRYLPRAPQPMADLEASHLFLSGQAAVTLSGPWTWAGSVLVQTEKSPAVAAHGRAALPLGLPFTGAEHLVVWKHTREPQIAVELIRFLTSRLAQSAYPAQAGLLPVRRDLLAEPPFTTDPVYQVMARALRDGRSYPLFPRWGLIEDRLVSALAQIWQEVLATPHPDVEALVRRQLEPLAHRLNLTLAAQ